MPKNVIDGFDHVDITVSDYTSATSFDSMKSNDTHTIVSFSVPQFTRQLEIKGTHVVPEFSSMAAIVIVISIAAVIVLTRMNTKRIRFRLK